MSLAAGAALVAWSINVPLLRAPIGLVVLVAWAICVFLFLATGLSRCPLQYMRMRSACVKGSLCTPIYKLIMECVLTGFVRPLSLPATVWGLMRRLLISVLTFVLDVPNIVCLLYPSQRLALDRGWGLLASHHHRIAALLKCVQLLVNLHVSVPSVTQVLPVGCYAGSDLQKVSGFINSLASSSGPRSVLTASSPTPPRVAVNSSFASDLDFETELCMFEELAARQSSSDLRADHLQDRRAGSTVFIRADIPPCGCPGAQIDWSSIPGYADLVFVEDSDGDQTKANNGDKLKSHDKDKEFFTMFVGSVAFEAMSGAADPPPELQPTSADAAPLGAGGGAHGGAICCFGDSLTVGVRGDPPSNSASESYPKFLEELLRGAGYDFTVHNAGNWGDTTGHMAVRLPKVLSQLAGQGVRVDFVLVLGGTNDVLRGEGGGPHGILARLRHLHGVASAAPSSPAVGVVTVPPARGLGQRDRTRLEVNRGLRSLCQQPRRFLVDLEALDVGLSKDGVHYTAEGCAEMASRAFRALQPMLPAPAPPAAAAVGEE
ncbi:unnamed protein product [Prorocentrum cordatum]|uniref:SGNH hydrolase-type esterase domain-containing protein n=1 Tax=Prorocentrum cordatum TaxID=2364126 RepID=A0ABN9QI32_9DINO|nr:unnamed protein product [Polarella glacialis]